MKALRFGLGSIVIGLLVSCGGGNNNNRDCGNGDLDAGEQCDDGNNNNGDGCSDVCTEETTANLDCPRLVELPKFCVPLPGSGEQLTEQDPNDTCGAGFFPEQAVNNEESFEVRKLFSDTILIKETNNFTGERPVMVLFLGDGKALLWDSGHESRAVADLITPFLQGRSVELLNTHLHGDHIGNNPDFDVIAIETPEVDAFCNVNGFDDNQAADCNNNGKYTPPIDQALFENQTFTVVRVVKDGHKIDLGNGRIIEVLATPGHSETSTSLVDPSHRLLLTGDTLYPDDEIGLIHPNGSNFAQYLDTTERYADLEADTDIVIGAHSQGVMPARILSSFLSVVQDHANGGNQDQGVDNTCDSGGFIFDNFPQ